MIYYQAVYYGRLGSYHSNKNIPSIQHRVYVSLTSYWMYENSGAGCCDFPSPLTQLEKYSTISVKRTLKGEILAINYVHIEMTCNILPTVHLTISNYLFCSKYNILLYRKRRQKWLWVNTDVSSFGFQNEEM